MRKAVRDRKRTSSPLSIALLGNLAKKGFKFVQVKGITVDRHYDYTEPDCLILVPLKKLPCLQELKDIYEPVDSEMLRHWASHPEVGVTVLVAIV